MLNASFPTWALFKAWCKDYSDYVCGNLYGPPDIGIAAVDLLKAMGQELGKPYFLCELPCDNAEYKTYISRGLEAMENHACLTYYLLETAPRCDEVCLYEVNWTSYNYTRVSGTYDNFANTFAPESLSVAVAGYASACVILGLSGFFIKRRW